MRHCEALAQPGEARRWAEKVGQRACRRVWCGEVQDYIWIISNPSTHLPDRQTKRYCLDAKIVKMIASVCLVDPWKILLSLSFLTASQAYSFFSKVSAVTAVAFLLFRWLFWKILNISKAYRSTTQFLTLLKNIKLWTAKVRQRHVAPLARLLWMHKATWRRPFC